MEEGRGREGKTEGTETGRRDEERVGEGRWTPQFLRCGCDSDYNWKEQSDKAAHKVG